jgi:hypothetical protein
MPSMIQRRALFAGFLSWVRTRYNRRRTKERRRNEGGQPEVSPSSNQQVRRSGCRAMPDACRLGYGVAQRGSNHQRVFYESK